MSSEGWVEGDSFTFTYNFSSPSSKSVRSTYTHTFTSPAPDEDENREKDRWVVFAQRHQTLPIELIDYIFSLYFGTNPSFFAIKPFSLASSQFRHIALRTFFSSLQVTSSRGIKAWVKIHALMLSNKTSLENVEDGRSTQKNRVNGIFSGIDGKTWFPRQLTSLTLTALWRIDVPLLTTIAVATPFLKTLHLSCSEHLDISCCWLCFEESSSVVVHSPIPNHFANVSCLTNEFGKALKPLTCLSDLHLGIFLSDDDILDAHLDDYSEGPRTLELNLMRAVHQVTRSSSITSVLSQMEDGPSNGILGSDTKGNLRHLCERCSSAPDFNTCRVCDLVVLAPEVRTRELEASLNLARRLRSLHTIGWSSLFAPSPRIESDGDLARATKVFIRRMNGRIRVRRKPWN
ncbi:hypothetical protein BJ138DRAFT_1192525 [Hygrophoropsis aurantiaca]|uniref:Uncharacterized protein n=1 Tax=Hygrophoropsis aurantiaca TaxID=72124 RepID=A0ACB8AB20_9AGAM|nr:hypothetical protein BJ138DRAFT_1192525 [Hygrophoropsis aurantiaca]